MAQLDVGSHQGFRIAERLLRLDWFLVVLVCTIGAVGIGMLISASGGSTGTVGIAPDGVVRRGSPGDARSGDDRHRLLAARGLHDLRPRLRPAGRRRSSRRGGHGRAALDRPRRDPATALGTHEDRAGAGTRALFPRRRPRRTRPHPDLPPAAAHDPRTRRADPAPARPGDCAAAGAWRRGSCCSWRESRHGKSV